MVGHFRKKILRKNEEFVKIIKNFGETINILLKRRKTNKQLNILEKKCR